MTHQSNTTIAVGQMALAPSDAPGHRSGAMERVRIDSIDGAHATVSQSSYSNHRAQWQRRTRTVELEALHTITWSKGRTS